MERLLSATYLTTIQSFLRIQTPLREPSPSVIFDALMLSHLVHVKLLASHCSVNCTTVVSDPVPLPFPLDQDLYAVNLFGMRIIAAECVDHAH